MAREIVIQFDADGQGLALHTDFIPLAELGRLDVRRASRVEFNGASQQWEVTLTGEPGASFSNTSRAVCLDWETETLNRQLLMT